MLRAAPQNLYELLGLSPLEVATASVAGLKQRWVNEVRKICVFMGFGVLFMGLVFLWDVCFYVIFEEFGVLSMGDSLMVWGNNV